MSDERIALLKSRKAVLDGRHRLTYRFENLLREWQKQSQAQGTDVSDVFPVRAAAMLEVFIRGFVREIVNHSKIYAERAIPLLSGFKSDYAFLIEVSHETITFGDIVAHAISVSSIAQIISIFETLSGQRLAAELPKVVDRWKVEIEGKPNSPIVADFNETIANVEILLHLRHRICHEASSLTNLERAELTRWLGSLADFANALDWFFLNIMHGRFPLDQTGMNLAAISKAQEADVLMQKLLNELYNLLQNLPRALKLVKTCQHAWERYRDLAAYCAHDPKGGGTIGPLIRANEVEMLTQQRIEQLRKHMAFQGS